VSHLVQTGGGTLTIVDLISTDREITKTTMAEVWRRRHDNGKAIGDVVNWMNGSFNLQVTVNSAPLHQDRFQGALEEAKTVCDDLVQDAHPHACAADCGRWMTTPQ
jgi:hypothetical protein